MATPKQIRDAVDAKLAGLWSVLRDHEDTFFAVRGRYKQLLRSHSTMPKDGTETLPDIGDGKPYYETGGYPAALKAAALPMSLEVHQYITPRDEAGFVVMVEVQIGTEIWQRIEQVGVETWRTHNWMRMEKPA